MSQDVNTSDLSTGHLISNRYYLEKKLGVGGMGSVYLARDTVLENSKVAVKILHSDSVTDESQTKRFLREVQLMRTVNHVNVVRTYDVGVDGTLLYYTMEYVEGESLGSLIKSGTLSYTKSAELLLQICEGLQAIHDQDIIHRDLKPANIMIVDGNLAKITDFGVARAKNSELTQHDEIIGSVNYIAPEIWLGKGFSYKADIYSLGIILFEMLVGNLPFDDDEPATMMWYHVKQPPAPPRSSLPDCPSWLNQLTLKMLEKAPSDRPKSASEIASKLYARLQTMPSSNSNAITISRPAVTGASTSYRNVSASRKRANASMGGSRTGSFPGVPIEKQGMGKVFYISCAVGSIAQYIACQQIVNYIESLLLL